MESSYRYLAIYPNENGPLKGTDIRRLSQRRAEHRFPEHILKQGHHATEQEKSKSTGDAVEDCQDDNGFFRIGHDVCKGDLGREIVSGCSDDLHAHILSESESHRFIHPDNCFGYLLVFQADFMNFNRMCKIETE